MFEYSLYVQTTFDLHMGRWCTGVLVKQCFSKQCLNVVSLNNTTRQRVVHASWRQASLCKPSVTCNHLMQVVFFVTGAVVRTFSPTTMTHRPKPTIQMHCFSKKEFQYHNLYQALFHPSFLLLLIASFKFCL